MYLGIYETKETEQSHSSAPLFTHPPSVGSSIPSYALEFPSSSSSLSFLPPLPPLPPLPSCHSLPRPLHSSCRPSPSPSSCRFPLLLTIFVRRCVSRFVGRLYHSGYSPPLRGLLCGVIGLRWASLSSSFASGFATAVPCETRRSHRGSLRQRCAALIVVHNDSVWVWVVVVAG